MTRYDMLKAIESCDPDGGEVKPTEADYDRHRVWAVNSFGVGVWDIYRAGGWSDWRGDVV